MTAKRCGNCKYGNSVLIYGDPQCRECEVVGGAPNKWEPENCWTNADRMNAMSIEEKAALIVDEILRIHHAGMRETAYSAWVKWLQKPAE